LKSSNNLTEKEYRLKEKALKRSEEDDIRDLKGIIIHMFSEAKIKGFENRDQLLSELSGKA
jgi:hypothetical protein